MSITAVILAGGKGERMESDISKQYIDLLGKPILARTIEIFEKNRNIDDIIIVAPLADLDYCEKEIVFKYGYRKVKLIVSGGKNRMDSSHRGLNKGIETDYVMIHDGVRPFVTQEEINALAEQVKTHNAVILAVPVKETIKKGENFAIAETVDRQNLWAAQTPQCFSAALIKEALEKAILEGFQATDDASVLEHFGHNVYIVEGSYKNIKITTKEDLIFAQAILNENLF